MPANKAKNLDELDEYFSFKIADQNYVLPLKTKDVMSPGWVRQNRRRDETDYFMTLLEELCLGNEDNELEGEDAKLGKEILKVLDRASWDEHKRIQKELGKHLQVTLGE